MFPYHSPVRQNTGFNDNSNSPPKSSRVPISLHGLFGETLGIDDQSVTSFSLQQSPPCGSAVFSKRTSSKSPIYSNSNSQFQTVLLSELADITPQNGLLDFSYQRSALCSYISPYDNRRCTYLAIAAPPNTGKSFCAKHSEFAKPILYNSEINNNPTISYQLIKPHLNNNNKIKDEVELSKNYQVKQDLNNHGITLNTLNSSTKKDPQKFFNGDNNKLVPQVTNVSHKKTNRNKNIAKSTTKNNSTLQKVKDIAEQLNGQHSNVLVNEIGSKEKKVLSNGGMDGDVLQAVVDLLNKNHDQLTSKQQIELLNSLGVMVTTVNNPNELVNGNAFMTNKNKGINFGNSGMFNASLKNEKLHSSEKKSHPKKKSNSTMSQDLLVNSKLTQQNLHKRKCDPTENVSGKKMKKTDIPNSLSHLTSVELNNRVSETIASIGGFTSNKTASNKTLIPVKKVVKTSSHSAKKVNLTPTVDILMNSIPNINNLKIDTSKNEIMEFANHLIDQQLNSKGIFPIRPFCNDVNRNVCTCKNIDYKFEVPKSKQRNSVKQLTRLSLGRKCTNKNCQSTGKFMLPTNFPLNFDLISRKTLNENKNSATDKTNCTKFCKLLKSSKKLYKNVLKTEKQSLKLLVNAVKSDSNATAVLIKQVEPTKILLSRRSHFFPKTLKQCMLKNKSGEKCCRKIALPLCTYCHEHILHCDYQQLYKSGPDMKARADIVPEYPVLRPRKKTKVLPLSKRKKRKIKKNKIIDKNMVDGEKSSAEAVNVTVEDAKETGLLDGHDVLLSQPINYTSPEMEHYDEKSSVMKSEDVSLTENLNMSDESLSILVDEDSSSALESFSLDGTLLNEVMPEVFQELGFLGGQGGNNLDSAYLLGNSESLGKLSFEEITADSLFYPNTTTPELLQDSFSSEDISNLNGVFLDKNHNETNKKLPRPNENELSQKESELSKTWNNEYSLEFQDNNLNESSSFDSSFADDLNEIEGVIQSLQEETDNRSLSKINGNNFVEINLNGYSANALENSQATTTNLNGIFPNYNISTTNVSERLVSNGKILQSNSAANTSSLLSSRILEQTNAITNCNAQGNNTTSQKFVTDIQNSSLPKTALKNNLKAGGSVALTTGHNKRSINKSIPRTVQQVYVTNSLFTNINTNKNNLISTHTTAKPVTSTINQMTASKTSTKSNTTLKKQASKTVSVTSGGITKKTTKYHRKLNGKNAKLQMDQLLPTLHKQNLVTKSENNQNVVTRFPTITTISPTLNSRINDKVLGSTTSMNAQLKTNNSVKMPGYVTSGSHQNITPTFQLQPGLINGGIMCTGNNAMANRNMVLIPVNAVMRPNTDNQNNPNNSGMGLTFAVPAQSGFNSQIGAVIRCSAMLSNDNQKIIVFNGMPPTTNLVNVMSSSNVSNQNMKPTVTAGQTVMLPTTKKPINNKHQSIVIAPALSQVVTPTLQDKKQNYSSKPKPPNNINRQSLVIPPTAATITSNATLQYHVKKKKKTPDKVTSTDNGGTVHWNPVPHDQKGPIPPVPRPKEHGTVGGQTANMLYCRRISPSLNNVNSQHVILGRLGSLGRVGLSHLKVTEKANLKSTVNLKNSVSVKKETAKKNPGNHVGFIPLPPPKKANPTTSIIKPVITVSNTTSNINSTKIADMQQTIEPVKVQTSKHNCRKTEHTTTLKDPDFVEAKN